MSTSWFNSLVILFSCLNYFETELLIELYGTLVIHLNMPVKQIHIFFVVVNFFLHKLNSIKLLFREQLTGIYCQNFRLLWRSLEYDWPLRNQFQDDGMDINNLVSLCRDVVDFPMYQCDSTQRPPQCHCNKPISLIHQRPRRQYKICHCKSQEKQLYSIFLVALYYVVLHRRVLLSLYMRKKEDCCKIQIYQYWG